MVVSAYLGDKPVFDSLRRFLQITSEQAVAAARSVEAELARWEMVNVDGADSATGMAISTLRTRLCWPDAQWGSSGSIGYRTDALSILSAILSRGGKQQFGNAQTRLLGHGQRCGTHTRPSDFMTIISWCSKFDTAAAEWSRIYDSAAAIVKPTVCRRRQS